MRTGEGVALGGRYRLVRTIAVGGMGEVWEALDESLARPVAVKVLRPEFAGDGPLLARFRVEARNSANLSHPNIAPLFDYGEDSGTAYLVMELVPGEPLSDILEAEPVMASSRLLPILSQTARGLHYAHQMGVVHRDVKPGNLLVEASGRVRITDFGVSIAADQTPMTATGMVMGTAQYLSPEQAVGRPATALSDLYALGIVAYEAVAGHRPFTGGSAVDIAVAQVNDPVPPLPGTVDARLASLIMQLLDKNPANRPQSGAELAQLFDALVARTPQTGVPLAAPAGAAPRPAGHARHGTVATDDAAQHARPPAFPPRSAAPAPVPAAIPPGIRPGAPVAMGPEGQPLARRAVRRGAPARIPGAPPGAGAGLPARGPARPAPTSPRSSTPVGGSGAPPRPAVTSRPGAATTRPAARPRPAPRTGPRWPRIALLVVGLLLVALLGALLTRAVLAEGPATWPDATRVAALPAPIPSTPSTVPTDSGTLDRGGQQ